jgi:hypothetical protein
MGLMKRDKVKSKEDLMFRDGGSIKNIKVLYYENSRGDKLNNIFLLIFVCIYY